MEDVEKRSNIYIVFCDEGSYDDYEKWVESVWLTEQEADKRKEEILDLKEEDRNAKLDLADELQEKEKAGLIPSWVEAYDAIDYKNKVSEKINSVWIETYVIGEKSEIVKTPWEKEFEDWKKKIKELI